jgi:UDP-glucose 4-epimerase
MGHEIWLITGGAGYIGSHVADQMIGSQRKVIIYDSLSRGLESRIKFLELKHKVQIPFIVADIRDLASLDKAIKQFKPTGVIHTAALKSVTESMSNPDDYFSVNFEATKSLIELLGENEIKKLIFSSTAAVYGSPDTKSLVKENVDKNPVSPYGVTKLLAENLVNEFASKDGNIATSLRFFNVVGTAAPELVDNSRDNLIPILIDRFKQGILPEIFGTNYDTPDGTCIRDYVDVRDVARAHIIAADHPKKLPLAMNVGTGIGISVREIISLVALEFGIQDVISIESQRRAGDPSLLCADVSFVAKKIGFHSNFKVQESIKSIFGSKIC